jgi:hypothetical protein
MSAWGLGSPWGLGFPWGAPQTGADYGCTLAQSGILAQSQGGNFSDWMCAFGEEIGSCFDVLTDIMNAYSLEYAVGAPLDVLGSILGLPRSGFGDTRYRTFLFIQRDLVLGAASEDGNWTGTGENIITICRRFIGPASGDPIVAMTAPPYAFILTVPDVSTQLEMLILVSFLRKAIYLAVLGYIEFAAAGDPYWASASVSVTDAGIWGSASVAVAGEALWSYVILIGDP